jgi:hypothetical protein
MNLIFLHGAPAAGKLTVARELTKLIDSRLLDNHASIDFARTLFEFGTPEFWRLVQSVRVLATEHAAATPLPNLICTYCYSEPDDRPHFDRLLNLLEANGGRMLPVFLHCDQSVLLKRVGNADRVERRKLASVEGLTTFLTRWKIAPVSHPELLNIDTAVLPPDAAAREIATHFGLL